MAPSDTQLNLFTSKTVRLTVERERRSVIISLFGKSYDTSNGTETEFVHSTCSAQETRQAASQRWEDDGGSSGNRFKAARREPESKPAWSVRSLRDLNRAIREEARVDNPRRLHEEAQRVERERARASQVTQERKDRAVRAERDRYGNAWEHPCQ
jgi:hypothetical protein